MRYRCERCGCSLDPGEHCECENREPCIDTPRRQATKKRTVYPREWDSEEYLKRRWLEYDMR